MRVMAKRRGDTKLSVVLTQGIARYARFVLRRPTRFHYKIWLAAIDAILLACHIGCFCKRGMRIEVQRTGGTGNPIDIYRSFEHIGSTRAGNSNKKSYRAKCHCKTRDGSAQQTVRMVIEHLHAPPEPHRQVIKRDGLIEQATEAPSSKN